MTARSYYKHLKKKKIYNMFTTLRPFDYPANLPVDTQRYIAMFDYPSYLITEWPEFILISD